METKHAAPLYSDWIPPKLLHREDELRQMLEHAAETSLPSNLWVEGAKGLGKTLTCKFFAEEVVAKALGTPFYIQCEPSFTNSLRRVYVEKGIKVRQRDVSPSWFADVVLRAFPDERMFYFIIDDPETVKDLRVVDGFIRHIYNVMTSRGRQFSIIVVTRMSLTYAERVMESLKSDSRLRPIPIVFKPYNVSEMTNILKQRLYFAFEGENLWDDEAVVTIANHVARVGSDAREALDILRHSVRIAKDRLTVKDAEDAVDHSKNTWWESQLLALPKHWAFILYLAAKNAYMKHDVAEVDAPKVIETYKREARKYNVEPLSKTPIYNALRKMSEARGFFDLEKSRSGWHETLILRFDESSARHIIKAGDRLNWEEMLLYQFPLYEYKEHRYEKNR